MNFKKTILVCLFQLPVFVVIVLLGCVVYILIVEPYENAKNKPSL